MYLWKYLSPERANVFSDLTLRFTQAAAFNDPFEVVPYVAELLPQHAENQYFAQFDSAVPELYEESLRKVLAEHDLTLDEIDSFLAESGSLASARKLLTPPDLIAQAKDYLKLFSRAAVDAATPTFGRSFQEKFGERFGILSLSADPSSLLMWAHYADCHRGFVLGLRAEHEFLIRKDAVGAIGRALPVEYAQSRPAITAYDPSIPIETHANRLVRQILLTKSVEWKYEREYRMVLPLDDQTSYPHHVTGHDCHLFSVPPEAIAAVIFGARMTSEAKTAIREALSTSPILRTLPVFQAQTSDTEFALTILPA